MGGALRQNNLGFGFMVPGASPHTVGVLTCRQGFSFLLAYADFRGGQCASLLVVAVFGRTFGSRKI